MGPAVDGAAGEIAGPGLALALALALAGIAAANGFWSGSVAFGAATYVRRKPVIARSPSGGAPVSRPPAVMPSYESAQGNYADARK